MKRSYLLDTDVVSRLIKGQSPAAVDALSRLPRSLVGVSVITEMELRFGLAKHPAPHRLRPAVDDFLEAVQVHQFPDDIAAVYAEVRWALERAGRPIGPLDTMIAAHAVALGAVLVTHNVREFGRVQGLRCENWV